MCGRSWRPSPRSTACGSERPPRLAAVAPGVPEYQSGCLDGCGRRGACSCAPFNDACRDHVGHLSRVHSVIANAGRLCTHAVAPLQLHHGHSGGVARRLFPPLFRLPRRLHDGSHLCATAPFACATGTAWGQAAFLVTKHLRSFPQADTLGTPCADSCDVGAVVTMVNDLGARYNRTVWVTELDCPNAGGPVAHELAFMQNVTDVRLFCARRPCACTGWRGPGCLRMHDHWCPVPLRHHAAVTMLKQAQAVRLCENKATPSVL